MTAFVLVHGAWHGAWCWDALAPELEALGHDAIAVDLPCDDIGSGITRYADAVCAAIPADREDVVLVGHSLGGLTIPVVADRRPVRSLVFLCAMVPTPGERVMTKDAAAAPVGTPFTRDAEGRIAWCDDAAAIAALYPDCSTETAALAFAKLRPQATTPMTDRSPLREWPRVPRAAIVCRDDAVLDHAFATAQARATLGVEPIDLAGSHSPFLSRPAELARLLATVVEPHARERTP